MPWSYDPSRPPADRFQWWDDPAQVPDPAPARWPDEPRHRIRTGDPAAETARIAGEFTEALTVLVRDALDRLDEIENRR